MTSRAVILALLALWALAWGGSFVGLWLTAPTGDGFTRGLNRVMHFLAWQGVAGVLATLLFVLRKRVSGPLARALWVPPGLLLAFVLFLAGLILWVQLRQPGEPPPTTSPQTEPVRP